VQRNAINLSGSGTSHSIRILHARNKSGIARSLCEIPGPRKRRSNGEREHVARSIRHFAGWLVPADWVNRTSLIAWIELGGEDSWQHASQSEQNARAPQSKQRQRAINAC